jgi:hypothetical protein
MAYTIIPTILTGDTATAAWGNTHLKDNFAAVDALIDLQTSSFTDGGVLLGSGSGAITAMAVLANGSIIVGDGTTDPVPITLLTSSTGLLIHERGGIEADISAIVAGGLVKGTGTGTMGVLVRGTSNQILRTNGGGTDIEWADNTAAQIFTGQYTGDGSTSLGITGVGFQPVLLHISRRLTAEATQGAEGTWLTHSAIIDDDASGSSLVSQGPGSTIVHTLFNRIASLDADGFTVDDDSIDAHPNKSSEVYNYVAIG